MAGLLAIFAEFEREILRDRTRAGPAHARQNGKRLGRSILCTRWRDSWRKGPILRCRCRSCARPQAGSSLRPSV
jgi:DNA invertase Pin-like site-specific DNA recombinase